MVQSPLLEKARDGMQQGAVPSLALLRASCEPESAHLKVQCYRAVLELELRELGATPRVAVGSIKHMERLSFSDYSAKALARLRRTAPDLLPAVAEAGAEQAGEAGLSRDYAEELGNWKGFIAFYALRLCLAPLLESMLLIDRLQFLEESAGQSTTAAIPATRVPTDFLERLLCVFPAGIGGDTALLPIFEPSLSPRNFVLAARKQPRPQG